MEEKEHGRARDSEKTSREEEQGRRVGGRAGGEGRRPGMIVRIGEFEGQRVGGRSYCESKSLVIHILSTAR